MIGVFFHHQPSWFEKIFILSLFGVATFLTFDCYKQNLTYSSYVSLSITFVLIILSCIWICKEVHWLLSAGSASRSSTKWYLRLLRQAETSLLNKLFSKEIESLSYPTSFNEQMRLFLKDIERYYVKSWYSEISGNPSFLFDTHLLLEEILLKIVHKLREANWLFLIKHILIIYLNHLQEYKRAIRKRKNVAHESEHLENHFYRYTHPACIMAKPLDGLRISTGQYLQMLLQEFSPGEFSSSLESRIVGSIIARKVLCKLILHMEDPIWIYTKLLYFLKPDHYHLILDKKTYTIKEPDELAVNDDGKRLKSTILRKSDFSGNIFDRASKTLLRNGEAKKELQLPLPSTNISSVLGNLISSTAGPLLPDNASVTYHKMWLSPVAEFTQEISESFTPFFKSLRENLTPDESRKDKFLKQQGNVLTRSCSSDALSPEEHPIERKLVKTQSFDDGSGEIPQEEYPPGNVSPIYEEPEDFATTIAKLRSVLQQRESSSTLSDQSGQSLDFPNQNVFDQTDESTFNQKFNDRTNEPVVEEVKSPFETNIAFEVPNDGRPFVNVSIPRTKLVSQSDTGASHVVYVIQYDAIYLKQIPDGESQLVLRTSSVKRRFQEFVALQNRLEENPALKHHLRGIKGPSKWIVGNKIDESNRKNMLESYLQQLCNNVELATSLELQQFLAYGTDGTAVFLEKTTNSPSLSRIDKFLSNKVTGVFNSLKTALPFDFEASSPGSNGSLKDFKVAQDQNLLQGFLGFGNKPEPEEIVLDFVIKEPNGETVVDHVRLYLSRKSECIEDAFDVLDSNGWQSDHPKCQIFGPTGCIFTDFKEAFFDEDSIDAEAPILSLVVDIICELLDDHSSWVTKESFIHFFKLFSTHWEYELKKHLGSLDWDRITANLLRLFRTILFTHEPCENVELDFEATSNVLSSSIVDSIPRVVSTILGADAVTSAVKLFLNSLSQKICNRDAILRLFDIFMTQLLSCPHLRD